MKDKVKGKAKYLKRIATTRRMKPKTKGVNKHGRKET
jgi:hypothetical protein